MSTPERQGEPANPGYDELSVTFALEPDDWIALGLALSGTAPRRLAAVIATVLAVGALVTVASADREAPFVTALGLLPWAVMAGLTGLSVGLRRRRLREQLRHAVSVDRAMYPLGRHLVGIGPCGVRYESPETRSETGWAFVERIATDRERVLLYTGPTSAWMIPVRAFASGEALGAFVEAAERWRSRSSAHEPAPEAAPGEGHADFALSFALTSADYEAVVRWATREANPLRPKQVVVLAVAALSTIPAWVLPDAALRVVSALFLVGAFLSAPALWAHRLVPWTVRRTRRRYPARFPMREQQVHVGPAGILQLTENGRFQESWGRIQRIVDDAAHFYLYNGAATAFLVPKRAFASPGEAERFHARALAWQHAAPRLAVRDPGPLRAPATEPADPFAPPEP